MPSDQQTLRQIETFYDSVYTCLHIKSSKIPAAVNINICIHILRIGGLNDISGEMQRDAAKHEANLGIRVPSVLG